MNSITIIIGIIFCCCIIILISNNVRRTLETPTTISHSIDPLLSPAACTTLHALLTPTVIATTKASDLLEKLRIAVPAQTLTINRQRPGHAHIQIKASEPLFNIHNEFVVTKDGNIAHHTLFTQQSIEGIPLVKIDNTAVLNKKSEIHELHTFMSHLPSTLQAEYNVLWHDKTNIMLTQKKIPYHQILCHAKTFFVPKLQQRVKKMAQLLEKRNYENRNKKIWQIDVRFTSLIVLSPTLGEKYENNIA